MRKASIQHLNFSYFFAYNLSKLSGSLKCLIIITFLFISACSVNQINPVPGLGSDTAKIQEITESDILAALKCQMSKGFLEVTQLKASEYYKKHPGVEKFNFKSGSGTFSGQLKTVKTNGGSINIIFPFSGFDGTNTTPSYSRTLSSTSTQLVKRTFDINPSVDQNDLELCRILDNRGIEVGSFISDSIVNAFTGIMNEPLHKDYKTFGPKITNTIVETTSSFTVVKKDDGGFSLKIVPTSPRIDEGNPSLAKSIERSDIYTVTTKLPTKVAEKSDARKIHFCLGGSNDASLCVEEPYTRERYDLLLGYISNDSSDINKLNIGESNKSDLFQLEKADTAGISRILNLEMQSLPATGRSQKKSDIEELIKNKVETENRFPPQQEGPEF